MQTDIFGNELGATGDNYSECYNQNLYNNDRLSNEDNQFINSIVAYPNSFNYKISIEIELESDSALDLFIIDKPICNEYLKFIPGLKVIGRIL